MSLGNLSDIRSAIGVIAALVAMAALVPYVRSILAGVTRPSRASWIIWTVVGVMTALSYRASGASATEWLALAYVVNPLVVVLLLLRYQTPRPTWLDWACLLGTGLSVIPWLFYRSAPVALYINVTVDALGALPTLRKAYDVPEAEDTVAWALAFAASALNLCALDTWALRISIHPLYAFAYTSLIFGTLMWRGRARARSVPVAGAASDLP